MSKTETTSINGEVNCTVHIEFSRSGGSGAAITAVDRTGDPDPFCTQDVTTQLTVEYVTPEGDTTYVVGTAEGTRVVVSFDAERVIRSRHSVLYNACGGCSYNSELESK